MNTPLALLFLMLAAPRGGNLTTVFEQSAGRRTATYAETVACVERLASASPWVHVEVMGQSGEGRTIPIVVVDRKRRFTPETVRRSGNAIVLVQAGIHAGEIDGKDAGLMLIREMAVDRSLERLLEHVTLLFIPILNVDGHENMSQLNRANQKGPENPGFRANAANLNLNRDYMKADSPEIRAWLRMFNAWQPDLFVDCHVTDGADYRYVITYIVEQWQYTDPAVAAWSRDRFLAPLVARMTADGLPPAPYCEFRKAHDPSSGMRSWASTPRFSTGYATLRNRGALLIESHMLKDYATRVRGTHQMLLHALEIVNAEHETLRAAVAGADRRAASPSFRGEPVPLVLETSYEDSSMIDFLGVDCRVEQSDVTGGEWFRYGTTPITLHIPYFYSQRVTHEAGVPEAYIVPPQWTDVIARLEAHGIELFRTDRPRALSVRSVRFRDVHWRETPFEGRHPLTYSCESFEETRDFPAGSVVVDMAQPLARVAAHLLEPEAPDALVQWGFFDAAFEEKEYIESYVMEGEIRKMLAGDPKLAAEFAEARKDSALVDHPERIRRWFYQRTPYFERRAGVYPVASILDRTVVDTLRPRR